MHFFPKIISKILTFRETMKMLQGKQQCLHFAGLHMTSSWLRQCVSLFINSYIVSSVLKIIPSYIFLIYSDFVNCFFSPILFITYHSLALPHILLSSDLCVHKSHSRPSLPFFYSFLHFLCSDFFFLPRQYICIEKNIIGHGKILRLTYIIKVYISTRAQNFLIFISNI